MRFPDNNLGPEYYTTFIKGHCRENTDLEGCTHISSITAHYSHQNFTYGRQWEIEELKY